MKILLIMFLSIFLFNGVSTTKIELINDSFFFYATIQCDTDEDVLYTQFTKDGDVIGRHITLKHDAGKRGHTISKYAQTNFLRIRVGNHNYVYEIVNGFGGKCKLNHQYETVSS